MDREGKWKVNLNIGCRGNFLYITQRTLPKSGGKVKRFYEVYLGNIGIIEGCPVEKKTPAGKKKKNGKIPSSSVQKKKKGRGGDYDNKHSIIPHSDSISSV